MSHRDQSSGRRIRVGVLCSACVLATGAWLIGCEREPGEDASSAPVEQDAGSLDAASYWANYDKADWASVRGGMPGPTAMEAFTIVARFVDRCHGGEEARVELFCDAHGRVFDRDGNVLTLSVEQWKGIHELIESAKAQAAVRAFPAPMSYGDGFGRVARFAYVATVGPAHTIVMEVVRPLNDISDG